MKVFEKMLMLLLVTLLLIGCQSDNNNTAEKSIYPNEDDIKEVVSLQNETEDFIYNSFSGDLAYALDTPEGLQQAIDEVVDVVAIIQIDTVNYSNWDPVTKEYVLPFTHGDATILKVLNGQPLSEQITYRRFGGILPYEEYIKGSNAPEKVASLQKENNIDPLSLKNTQVVSRWNGDIDVEEGIVYLVFMVHDEEFHQEDEYWLEGFQYGLREVQSPHRLETITGFSSIKIKNNDTGTWEALSTLGVLDF